MHDLAMVPGCWSVLRPISMDQERKGERKKEGKTLMCIKETHILYSIRKKAIQRSRFFHHNNKRVA
eukprot:c50263_g1_i1 orf=129-326(+)